METITPVAIDQSTQTEVERLESWTRSIVVTNNDQRSEVFNAIKSVKSTKDRIVNFFKVSKDAAFAAHRAICANEKSFTDRLDAFESAGKRAISAYDTDIARQAEAERRRLQAIADEQARKEREKAEAEARKQREKEADERRKAEDARRAAEAANAEERARLLREAEKAELKAAAAAAKAEEKIENAATITAPCVQFAVPVTRQEGESQRVIWKARVTNQALVPREYMIVNERALDGIAKATKGALSLPGVEFYSESQISIRK